MSASSRPGTPRRRPGRPAAWAWAAVAVLTALVALIVSTDGRGGGEAPRPVVTSRSPETPPAEVAIPTAIEIPAIEVDARIVSVGLEADGSMETPDFGLAGWYAPGPRPGEPGPAVIAAHVDSRSGPDVFFRLAQLRPSDVVVVRDRGGTSRSFAVAGSEQSPKDRLPVDRIWGDTRGPALRLITCGGSFDRTTGRYLDNVIVYADAL